MKQKLLFLALLLFAISLKSQTPNFEWAIQIGDTNNDFSYCVAADMDGNLYTVGLFSGTVDFDAGAGVFQLTSVGGDDIFIQKNDDNGNFIWAIQLGGTGNDEGIFLTTDLNNNILITGKFSGTVDFDPGVGVNNITSNGLADIFVLKLNSNGNFVWVRQMGSLTRNDAGKKISTDSNGNVYTIGTHDTIIDFDPSAGVFNLTPTGTVGSYIQKLDSNGNFIWAKELSGSSITSLNTINIDINNEIYLAGQFDGTSDFDPGLGFLNLTSAGSYDAFVLKLDIDGNLIWAKQFGANNIEIVFSIASDLNGNIYLTGTFLFTVDFDPGLGVLNLTSAGSTDIYILKLDNNGDFVWASNVGGTSTDNPYSIIVNKDKVYSTGIFKGDADMDPGVSNLNFTSFGQEDSYIQQIDTTGNFVWAGHIGGPSYDRSLSLTLGRNGAIYTTGYFTSTVDFDPNVGISNLTSYSTTYDGFILKLGTCFGINAGTDVVTACDTYTWIDNNTYTLSTTTPTYTIVNGSANGCDSIVTLNLTINTVDNSVISSNDSITANAVGANYQWLDCDNGNAIISGETNQLFVVPSNGNYAVEVTQNGCIDTSTCINVSTVGLKETKHNNISVYPNPTNGDVTISSESTFSKVELVNTLGQKVTEYVILESSTHSFKLPEENGFYFIKIYFNDSVLIKSIVKK